MKEILNKEPVRRSLRTFLETALGILVSAVLQASGVVNNVKWSSVIVLAVASGVAAILNMHPPSVSIEDEKDLTGQEDNL